MSGSERSGEHPGEEVEVGPVALARLLDEIRGDHRWREEVAALRAGHAAGKEVFGTLDGAIAAADQVALIAPGRPVLGDLWAGVRRLIHAEIRIYQDRQTAVNRGLATALRDVAADLRSISERLDALAPEIEPLRPVQIAVEQLEARVAELERHATGGGPSPSQRADD